MIDMKRDVVSTTDREILLTRVYDAPRERVFELWTKPEHVDRWWGPRGYSTQTESMDVRPGGTWKYLMTHAQHGTFDNLISYREVVRPERLVYSHGTFTEHEQFHVTVTFEAQGDKTRLTMHLVFPNPEVLVQARKYGADQGGHETLARLAELLASP
ncbi:SRPBCC family protein [Melittangium boletus]|uniref:SRPBCC family protein n=1 Tax=Melittangium boletus TaxID=83453 RepID=UPI003DA59A4D